MSFFDTHCHLDYLKERSLEETLKASLEARVSKMLTVSTEPGNLDTVLKIARTHPEHIFCSQGVHPHDAKSFTEETRDHILKNAEEEQVLAIGEIGLDYHYDHSPRKIQQEVFETQLEIGIKAELPIIIHTREAEEDTWAILKNFSQRLTKPLVLHSFTSDKWLAEKALEEGFFIGMTGIVTFKNADNVRGVLEIIPKERLLLETDAPFLAPVPKRGKENAPFFLPHIGDFICQFKNWEKKETLDFIYQNSLRFFQID